MRSVQVTEFGGPEVLRLLDVPEPEPGPGEVLIEVEAAEILFLDTQLRAGWGREYFAVEPPFVPGAGIAGTVAAVGAGVDEAWRDARVIAGTSGPGEYRGGGYAERAVAPVTQTHRVPDGVDPVDALAALHDGVMGVSRLEKAGLGRGDTALITAASGGIGVWLVPLLAADGVTVAAVANGEGKVDLARKRGATIAIDYAREDWPEDLAGQLGREVDVVFDGAGGAPGRAAFELLRRGGRFFSYGSAAGEFADVTDTAAQRDIQVVGIQEEFTAEDANRAAEVALRRLADGVVEPVIGQRLPLARAADAHTAIDERRVAGKSVLVP